jgi:plasmid maintenance system killer protein
MQKRINTLEHANEEQDLRSLEIKKDEPVKDDEHSRINIVGTG